MEKGFGKVSADPTMRILDTFALQNKMKPEDVHGMITVGDTMGNPASLADDQLAQIVHHGTPHTLSPEPGFPHGRFRLDKIGTGEGAQIRGKGIYFAESQDLGDQYRRNVSVTHLREKMFDMYSEGDDGIEEVMARLDEFTPAEQNVIKSLEEHDWLGFEYPHQAVREAFSKSAGKKYGDIQELLDTTKRHGSTYKLDLPDEDIDKMLDQDLHLDQQPSHVKQVLEGLANDPAVDKFRKKQKDLQEERLRLESVFGGNNLDWVQISKARVNADQLKNMSELTPKIRAGAVIKQMLESEKAAWPPGSNAAKGLKLKDKLEEAIGPDATAEVLREAGIPGAKFKDAVSRNANPIQQLVAGKIVPDTNNYTVWDQDVLDRVKMLERSGDVLFQGPSPVQPFYSKIVEAIDAGKVPNRVDRTQLEKTLLGYGVKQEELADLKPHMDELFAKERPWEGPASFGGQGNPMLPQNLFGRAPDGKVTRDALREMVQNKTLAELKVTELSQAKAEELYSKSNKLEVQRDSLPHSEATRIQHMDLVASVSDLRREAQRVGTKFDGSMVPGGVPGTARELLFGHPSAVSFGGGHYSNFPDTFAHARLDDVVLPDGSKSLRINEIQSDLHQLGAREGYSESAVEVLHPQTRRMVQETLDEVADSFGMGTVPDASQFVGQPVDDLYKYLDGFNTEDSPYFSRIAREELEANGIIGRESDNATRSGVVNAPFKKSWHGLALKQTLRTAAEEGYDSISLVKGKDIAERVGGPPDALGKFYDEKIANTLRKMVARHGGKEGAFDTSTGMKSLTPEDYAEYFTPGRQVPSYGGGTDIVRSFDPDGYVVVEEVLTGGQLTGRLRQHFTMPNVETWERVMGRTKAPETRTTTTFTIPQSLKDEVLGKGQPLYQPQRGMVSFGEGNKALINPINPDFSTAPHEVSHVLRRMLQGDTADTAAKIFGGEQGWSREAEEAFAQGAESYLQTASTKSPAMQQTMQQMNAGMAGVYDNPMTQRDGGEELFQRILGITENSSPLDKARIPGITGPLTAGAAYNALARFNTYGGTQ
jgi:hypothetical protein